MRGWVRQRVARRVVERRAEGGLRRELGHQDGQPGSGEDVRLRRARAVRLEVGVEVLGRVGRQDVDDVKVRGLDTTSR